MSDKAWIIPVITESTLIAKLKLPLVPTILERLVLLLTDDVNADDDVEVFLFVRIFVVSIALISIPKFDKKSVSALEIYIKLFWFSVILPVSKL